MSVVNFQIFPAATFGLGVWQTKRRAWKLDLIEQLEKKTSAPPILIPEE
jgi:surfeit locus 1 family protein